MPYLQTGSQAPTPATHPAPLFEPQPTLEAELVQPSQEPSLDEDVFNDDDLGYRFQDEDFEPPPKKVEAANPYREFGTESVPTAATVSAAKPRKQRSQFGPLLLGSFLSCIGAGLGIFIWFAVLIATEYEIGWIWWGMGALTGIGMQLGMRDDVSDTGGIIAAIIAFAAFGLIKGGLALLVQLGGGTLTDVLSPLDLLFVFLAVSSAYKIGGGGTDD